jgi:hypothetical protein
LTEIERRKVEQSLLASVENDEEPASLALHTPRDTNPVFSGNFNGDGDDNRDDEHQFGNDDDDDDDDAPI